MTINNKFRKCGAYYRNALVEASEVYLSFIQIAQSPMDFS